MIALQITLLIAALLCGLVAGLVFGFAVVVMPGIGSLDDQDFLRAFQVVDGVIQRGQPLFGFVWIGSAVAVLIAMAIGVEPLEGSDRLLLLGAGVSYLLGVQLPTAVVNIPLNNELQKLDLNSTDETAWRTARERFEPRWNRWNTVRTAVATIVTATLMVLLLRI